ncbi:MAG: hypothetical protein PWP51_1263 [Clostridiales bacterium]|nr:hypothetical protein [Clostridiales bacterium]
MDSGPEHSCYNQNLIKHLNSIYMITFIYT